jgi:hypothetical protein
VIFVHPKNLKQKQKQQKTEMKEGYKSGVFCALKAMLKKKKETPS